MLVDVPDPVPQPGEVIVDVVCVGVDGTDDEIIGGLRRTLRADDYLIVGPESLGRAATEPVRRPDTRSILRFVPDQWTPSGADATSAGIGTPDFRCCGHRAVNVSANLGQR